MAKLMLLDLETTGLNLKTDRITQFCVGCWDTKDGNYQDISGYLFDHTYPPITPEITKITGITEELLREQGQKPGVVLDRIASTLLQMDFLVAHNLRGFDLPLLQAECYRYDITLPKVHYIDTRTDLPYRDRLKCRVLTHLALELGYQVDMKQAHGAPYDVKLMKYVLSQFDLEPVFELCAQPLVVAKATCGYNDREKAKSNGYSWERIGEQIFAKTWVKQLRESQWADEEAKMSAIGVPLTKVTVE